MATLYLDKPGVELLVEGGTIVLRENEGAIQKLPASLVERIVASADVILRGPAIRRLSGLGIGVYWPANRHGEHALLWPGTPRSGLRKLGQARLYFKTCERERWAGRAIRGKLQGQIVVLRKLQERRPERRFELEKGRVQLSSAVGRLRIEEPTLESILGIEGAAGAAYFKALAQVFAPSLHFRGRNRRPPRDPVNATLSLGYTLLYHAALEAILAAGLEPTYGFLHEPSPGRASLACDLMEPFRPLVDWEIWMMWQNRTVRPESFAINQGACLLGKAGRRSFYSAFEEPMDQIRRKLREVCASFGRAAERLGAEGKGAARLRPASEWVGGEQ
jgi:CRISPR-associated protein Cas1